ncbi:MAG TPA: D-aminoacyl-tRNA deacylase [Oligoflexia bacterium]|nr:D-aminoacyl-tRNA deacylase [Oligoflexia bacterium]HMP49370.1 D-aminoacyl-tRNA deacylase [Oligoflexia bacterium]
MKLLLQRVSQASVLVEGQEIAKTIEGKQGLMVLVGIGLNDTESCIKPALLKLVDLRVFSDDKGRFDRSLRDIGGSLLLVPQFTLYADTKKGRRPDFFSAKPPVEASMFFDLIVKEAVNILGEDKVSSGKFGADMKVSLVNDGPVTIMLEFS